jgi:carbonic anhydrase/acetyltransferase-like protein (isoleucine patch superfamily)
MLYQFHQFKPSLSSGCFIAEDAVVIGQVVLGKDVSVFFKSVLRGDVNQIRIGDGTNVQDLSMLHVTEDHPLEIGKGVSIGHNVVLHGCKVGDNCLIGMGAIILDGAVIGDNSVVAAGSVVSPNKVFPGGVLIMGSPAKVVRELNDLELAGYGQHFKSYIGYKNQYLDPDLFIPLKEN